MTKHRWSEEEEAILREYYPKTPRSKIMKLLPQRTWLQIRDKAQNIGLERTNPSWWDEVKYDMTETEKAYIAGMLDGEGSIGINKTGNRGVRYMPKVNVVCSTDRKVVEEIYDVIGSLGVKIVNSNVNGRFGNKIVYNLLMGSMKEVYHLLRELLSYLRIKRKQAELVMEWIESKVQRFPNHVELNEREKEIIEGIRKLNA